MPRVPRDHPGVIISSTFNDLKSLRTALRAELIKARLLPIDMEHSVLAPASEITGNSLEMVEDATAYIGIISLRYGQVLKDPPKPARGTAPAPHPQSKTKNLPAPRPPRGEPEGGQCRPPPTRSNTQTGNPASFSPLAAALRALP